MKEEPAKDIVPPPPAPPAVPPLPVTPAPEPDVTLTGGSLDPRLGAQVDPSDPRYAYKKVANGYLIFQDGRYTGEAAPGSRAFQSIEQVLDGGKPLPRGPRGPKPPGGTGDKVFNPVTGKFE